MTRSIFQLIACVYCCVVFSLSILLFCMVLVTEIKCQKKKTIPEYRQNLLNNSIAEKTWGRAQPKLVKKNGAKISHYLPSTKKLPYICLKTWLEEQNYNSTNDNCYLKNTGRLIMNHALNTRWIDVWIIFIQAHIIQIPLASTMRTCLVNCYVSFFFAPRLIVFEMCCTLILKMIVASWTSGR